MLESFETYAKYKPSDIDWLGDIPEEWDLLPAMRFLEESATKNTGLVENQVLSLSYGRIVKKSDDQLTGLVPESFETYQIVEPGDIIVRGTDLQNDKTSLRTGLSNDRGIITSAYLNLRHKKGTCPRFLHYFFHSMDISKSLYKFGSGLRQNLSFEDFKRMQLPNIGKALQTAIADFLDEKTAAIDRAIAIKARQIALLEERKQILIQTAVTRGLDPTVPMKDSGVDWIGEIPAHWEVKSNQRIFREKRRQIESMDELPLSLSQVDGVVPSKQMKERSLKPSHRDNFKLCLEGDLVVNRFKGHLGVFFESAYRGIVTFHYGVFTPDKNCSSKYFEHLFHTAPYRNEYAGASNGMTIGLQNLSNQNFYSVKSIVPPYKEQLEINTHVAGITIATAQQLSMLKHQIENFREYRASLINAAVTGKIKVPA